MLELPPPEDDGLYIQPVNEWSKHKHHFLLRYIDGFTTAMRDKKWDGLHYIDLFAGAGIERLKKSRQLVWGSPLIAAQAKYPFTGIHVCEKNKRKYEALSARLDRFGECSLIQHFHGDANEKVHEIVARIPVRSLSLAFLDPWGLHLDYETLRILADHRVDLVIFFPDRLDILRNWLSNYFDNPNSNLDRVLGPGADWRRVVETTPREQLAEAFRELYKVQIAKLGYTEFEYERIPSTGRPLYLLIFCSKDPAGSKIWRGIVQKKPDQQRTFDFGSP